MAKYKINRVVIAARAQERYDEMVKDIEERYSPKIAQKFTDDFTDIVDKLRKHPAIFEYSDSRKDTRRALFSNHGAFLYKILEENTMLITTFFDTRMKRE